ncbi:MAG TPA: NAD(+) synthase [Candidatus Woesebacteria bacterium]|nr:NAD(+) synthase [Candidatus Woesebacteria bacterium]
MYEMKLNAPAQISAIVLFLQETFSNTSKHAGVIAVSGGIDSALSLSLLALALPKEQIWPILLPYERQDITDALTILDFWQIPPQNRKILNITSMVDAAITSLQIGTTDNLRKGNLMARTRMIATFDFAKLKNALVVGTENKTEHYLGYFTRFGDEASDVEPLLTLYKTQVRQLAQELNLPEVFLQKAPSAGLWPGQSDEVELGFSYELADQVLSYLIDKNKSETEIKALFALATPEKKLAVAQILNHIKQVSFKQQVPYHL